MGHAIQGLGIGRTQLIVSAMLAQSQSQIALLVLVWEYVVFVIQPTSSGKTPADNKCYACSITVPNCVNCASFDVCSMCDTANGYWVNPTTDHC